MGVFFAEFLSEYDRKRPKHVGGLLYDYTIVSYCYTVAGINTDYIV
jgi:hypothetical protein